MGTPARIIALIDDSRWGVTYVNYDGSLSSAGRTLLRYYQDAHKVHQLMKPGHMSYLGQSPDCPEGHSYQTPLPGYCIYYGRDRGEDDVDTDYFAAFQEAWEYSRELPGSYLYVWDGERWFYDYQGSSRPLEQALARHEED